MAKQARKAKRKNRRKGPVKLTPDQAKVLGEAYVAYKRAEALREAALTAVERLAVAITGTKDWRIREHENGIELYDHDYRKGG